MAKKPTKRELTQVSTDVFVDQLVTLEQETTKTGTKRAALIRQAIDKTFPRKEK